MLRILLLSFVMAFVQLTTADKVTWKVFEGRSGVETWSESEMSGAFPTWRRFPNAAKPNTVEECKSMCETMKECSAFFKPTMTNTENCFYTDRKDIQTVRDRFTNLYAIEQRATVADDSKGVLKSVFSSVADGMRYIMPSFVSIFDPF